MQLGGGPVQGGQSVGAGGGHVVDRARLDRGDPQWGAVGSGQNLDVAAEHVVFPGVSQVVAGGADPGDPITGDQGAVEDHVANPLVVAAAEDLVQVRSTLGEHVDAFVQVAVAGGLTDAGVPGQAVHTAALLEPAQHQHSLPEAAQHAAALRGADTTAVRGQQSGKVVYDGAGTSSVAA